MENVFKDVGGREITLENIEDGLWITTKDGVQHGLHDTIPRACDECGFPAMEILYKDYPNQMLAIGCPWCDAARQLCLVCGEMKYVLDLPEKHIHNTQ